MFPIVVAIHLRRKVSMDILTFKKMFKKIRLEKYAIKINDGVFRIVFRTKHFFVAYFYRPFCVFL